MGDIRTELEELEVQNYDHKFFIPLDDLRTLLPKSRVAALVRTLTEENKIEHWQESELVQMVVNNGLRVFATLLSFSRPDLIVKFKETDHFAHSQLDSRLPLSRESGVQILRDINLAAKFDKHQWRFLAPFFCADQSHRELHENVILPFTECKQLKEGGFGEVHKVTLAASHQALMSEKNGQVCSLDIWLTSSIDYVLFHIKDHYHPKADKAKEQCRKEFSTRRAHSLLSSMFRAPKYHSASDCFYYTSKPLFSISPGRWRLKRFLGK